MKNFNEAIFLHYITAEQQECAGPGTTISYRLHCHNGKRFYYLTKTSQKFAHQCNRILERIRTWKHYEMLKTHTNVTFSKKKRSNYTGTYHAIEQNII